MRWSLSEKRGSWVPSGIHYVWPPEHRRTIFKAPFIPVFLCQHLRVDGETWLQSRSAIFLTHSLPAVDGLARDLTGLLSVGPQAHEISDRAPGLGGRGRQWLLADLHFSSHYWNEKNLPLAVIFITSNTLYSAGEYLEDVFTLTPSYTSWISLLFPCLLLSYRWKIFKMMKSRALIKSVFHSKPHPHSHSATFQGLERLEMTPVAWTA